MTNANTQENLTGSELAEQCIGRDLLNMVVDELKALQDPWAQTCEEKQDEAIRRLENRIKATVRSAVNLIAANSNEVISAEVESVTFKDGVKAVLKAPKYNPAVHSLADAEGSSVVVVITDADQYLQDMESVRGEADQRALDLEAA